MARYKNPHSPASRRSLWHFLLWKSGYYTLPEEREKPPLHFSYPGSPSPFNPSEPSAVWIGHSTFLLEIDRHFILTDPVWSQYCSPVPLPLFRRKTSPPFPIEDLPPIDFVLISHNHYDHLDEKTVRHLHTFHPQIEWIVPAGLSPWFHRRSIFKVRELRWWESYCLSRICFTAVPAQHFSGRTLLDKNKSHWNGYVVEAEKKQLYFAGDTGYNRVDFKAIGERWARMHLSLIPIGAYIPKGFMKPVHISPEEAVQVHLDVRSEFSLGMHWNTFRLADEDLRAPPYDLHLAMEAKKLSPASFLPLEPGTYVNW